MNSVNKECPLCSCSRLKFVNKTDYQIIFSALEKERNIFISEKIKKSNMASSAVSLLRCEECEFEFFDGMPVGNEDFYKECTKSNEYNTQNKWEYDSLLSLLKTPQNIIDIGAGKGVFLEKAKAQGHDVCGFELNSDAVKCCVKKGLNVTNQNLYDFENNNREKYAVVCSFHVVEHVKEPLKFINALINICKPQGIIVLAVPNNDGVYKFLDAEDFPSNYPPHHVSRWKEKNIKYLAAKFNLKLLHLNYSDNNLNSYRNYYAAWGFKKLKRIGLKYIFFRKLNSLFWKLVINSLSLKLLKIFFANKKNGVGLVAVLGKNNNHPEKKS